MRSNTYTATASDCCASGLPAGLDLLDSINLSKMEEKQGPYGQALGLNCEDTHTHAHKDACGTHTSHHLLALCCARAACVSMHPGVCKRYSVCVCKSVNACACVHVHAHQSANSSQKKL